MRSRRPRALARGGALVISLVVAGTVFVPGGTVRAAEPQAAAAARHLAETRGGSPNDFELLYDKQVAGKPGVRTSGRIW